MGVRASWAITEVDLQPETFLPDAGCELNPMCLQCQRNPCWLDLLESASGKGQLRELRRATGAKLDPDYIRRRERR